MSNLYLADNLYDFEKIERRPSRDGYGEGLVATGATNKDVVVLCCDLAESTRSEAFKKQFPDRFFEVGVAEQNMAGIAAGLALNSKIPFITSYAVFSPGRNWDQIRVSICYTNANVKVVGSHAGISVGPDGSTHQGLEDIAITRVLPNMTVICPVDAIEGKKATIAAVQHVGPVYLRFMREATPVVTTEKSPFEIGKAYVYREGKDVTVVAIGSQVHEAILAARSLEEEISVEVINSPTVKPLDVETIVASAKKTGAVVTAEEHQITNGLGSAVAEVLGEHQPVPMARVGVPDIFGESGSPDELLDKYGMRAKNIIEAIHRALKRKKR
jgi:transketolase